MDAPNSQKITAQMLALKRLRAAADRTLPTGWGDGEITPPTANALVRAGLADVETVSIAADGKRRVVRARP